jgi:hypothetical protein
VLQCLADVPEEERCDCEHEPIPGNPGVKQVKVKPVETGFAA